MKIVIMMSVGCQNLGDELILKNEIKLLKEKYGTCTEFRVFTYDLKDIFYVDESVKYLEYFLIGIRNPKNFLRNLKNFYNFIKTIKWADKVIVGGGGIIFDNEAQKNLSSLNNRLFKTKIIKMFKKEIIFFGVSIDVKHKKNLKKVKKIFSGAKEVFVRDDESFYLLEDLGVKSKIILDPVFYDNGEIGLQNYAKNFLVKKVEAKTFSLEDLKDLDFSEKTVGLALRSGYLNDEKVLVNKIIDLILNSGGKVVLLPHSFHKTSDISNDLKFLAQFVKVGVSITSSMNETYLVYKEKKIDFCISMRLHSMILSQIYGIPFVALKYAKKCDFIE